MSIGSVAEFFLSKQEKTSSIQNNEIQPVVIPHSLQSPSKTPDEVRKVRNLQAKISSEQKAA